MSLALTQHASMLGQTQVSVPAKLWHEPAEAAIGRQLTTQLRPPANIDGDLSAAIRERCARIR